jgi:hypothetical protein
MFLEEFENCSLLSRETSLKSKPENIILCFHIDMDINFTGMLIHVTYG